MTIKKGATVRHTRRNGEKIKATVKGFVNDGPSPFVQIGWTDRNGVAKTLKCRESELRAA